MICVGIDVAKDIRYVLSHGEAWFQIFEIRPLQRNQVRLPLGHDLCRISGQETGRGQALQCCALSCSQEISAADLRYGEVPATVSRRCVTALIHIPNRRPYGRLLCYTLFEPSTNCFQSAHFRLDF